MNGLDPADYVVVALFLLGMLGMGVWFARRQESAEDYFVAGRRMPWLAVGLSTLATLTSTISYLGMPGEVIRNGIGYFTGLLGVPLTIAFLWFVTAPFLLRLRLTSVYEYLEQRFDYRARLLGVLLFACNGVGWMATVVYTAAAALAEMTGFPLLGVILVVGGVGVAYTTLGGIRADIWTDVVQAVIMFAGAIFTLGYVALATGTGVGDWWGDAARVRHTSAPLFDVNPLTRVSVVGVAVNLFVWHVCQSSANQVAAQRFFTMPSVGAARSSILVNGISNTALTVLLALCGMALFSFYVRHPQLLEVPLDAHTGAGADRLFPRFIAHQLPPAAAGLLIAALFAAAMSTIDSGVNSLSAVLTVDVVRRRAGVSSGRGELRIARRFTLAFGVLVTLLAVGVDQLVARRGSSLVEILPAAFNWAVGPLGGLFFAGMFLRRCTPGAAIAGTLAGAAVALVTALAKPVFGYPFSFAWVGAYSLLVTLGGAALLSLRAPAPSAVEPLTWRRIVHEAASESNSPPAPQGG